MTRFALTFVLVASLAGVAAAESIAPERLTRFHREWGGDASWTNEDGSIGAIPFCVKVEQVGETPRHAAMTQLKDYPIAAGAVYFSGTTVYEYPDEPGTLEMAGAVAPDGTFVMIEVHGTGSPGGGWVTEGAWIGRVDGGLTRLRAEWTPYAPDLIERIDLTPGCSKAMAGDATNVAG